MSYLRGGEYVTPNVSLIAGDNSVMFNPIIPTFTISIGSGGIYINGPYEFRKGMAWSNFLNSHYNNGLFMRGDNGEVLYQLPEEWGGQWESVKTENSYGSEYNVLLTDEIIGNYQYYIYKPILSPDEPA